MYIHNENVNRNKIRTRGLPQYSCKLPFWRGYSLPLQTMLQTRNMSVSRVRIFVIPRSSYRYFSPTVLPTPHPPRSGTIRDTVEYWDGLPLYRPKGCTSVSIWRSYNCCHNSHRTLTSDSSIPAWLVWLTPPTCRMRLAESEEEYG